MEFYNVLVIPYKDITILSFYVQSGSGSHAVLMIFINIITVNVKELRMKTKLIPRYVAG